MHIFIVHFMLLRMTFHFKLLISFWYSSALAAIMFYCWSLKIFDDCLYCRQTKSSRVYYFVSIFKMSMSYRKLRVLFFKNIDLNIVTLYIYKYVCIHTKKKKVPLLCVLNLLVYCAKQINSVHICKYMQ